MNYEAVVAQAKANMILAALIDYVGGLEEAQRGVPHGCKEWHEFESQIVQYRELIEEYKP